MLSIRALHGTDQKKILGFVIFVSGESLNVCEAVVQ